MPADGKDEPLQLPQESDSEQPISVHKRQFGKSALSSISSLSSRRSNASFSNLFASTTSLPIRPNPGSPEVSEPVTPTNGPVNGSVFSPRSSTAGRSSSPAPSSQVGSHHVRDLILRAFSPRVSVLASRDTEELIRHKGINGGLVELLRPFGDHVPGKVTIRDSTGVSRSWEDFAVRFTGVRDGLDYPGLVDRLSTDSGGNKQRTSLLDLEPARLRSGGDVPQVEELVERHLTFAEENSGPVEDYITGTSIADEASSTSPFYLLYLRRLLSGLPMIPSETLSHPVASVIAISSRSAAPIEELRSLYDSSNTGEHRLPPWVHNEFLRYYVLIHDEDYDDIKKSMALYDQMKRHFGLHCHLLRLRSAQCLPSDDDSVKLQHYDWTSAAEELAEIIRRETFEDEEDLTPYVFESDASAIRAFVREMVTQSIIPSMERASATWNDQVASRRRGLSGRFMSLSKRFTTFGNRNSSGPTLGGSSSNYDSLQGFYKPDAPEAVMRKLADYAIMLRDFKLAHSTYEILCQDFKNDKAWKYYAGANEMAAVSLLMAAGPSNKIRSEGVDQYLETAYYSYVTRVGAPYYALRTLVLVSEFLRMRGGNALNEAAGLSSRILEDRLVGPVGHVLFMERIGTCFSERRKTGGFQGFDRHRSAAFWNTLATDAWLRLGKASQAERCLSEAMRLYGLRGSDDAIGFEAMAGFLSALQEAVADNRAGIHHLDGDDSLGDEVPESMQQNDQLGPAAMPVSALASSAGHGHRKSASIGLTPVDTLGSVASAYGGIGAVPLSPHAPGAATFGALADKKEKRDDGFE